MAHRRQFNGIMRHDEKFGGRSRDESLINDFSTAVDDCNLIYIGFSEEPFNLVQ